MTKDIHILNPEQIIEPETVKQLRGFDFAKAPQTAITAPTGGATQDTQARTAINDLIDRLIKLGLIQKT